jgi:TIR domain
MNARIFVSYAREDQVPAGALVSFLRAAGFDVWFDKDSLHAGQDWRTVIDQEIAHARLLIICLSRSSVGKTGFVQKEMRLALQQAELRPSSQVYIIPVSLDGCTVPSALERLHVLDLGAPDASRRRWRCAPPAATSIYPEATWIDRSERKTVPLRARGFGGKRGLGENVVFPNYTAPRGNRAVPRISLKMTGK